MASESSENSYTLDVPDIASLPSLALEERKTLPTLPAVYFVYAATGAVLYVGSSKNLRGRWLLHHRQHQFEETQGVRIAWQHIEVAAHRLALEHHCIEILHPLCQQVPQPLRRDKEGRLLYEVKLRLPESTYMRLAEAAEDYSRTLPNQIIWTLKHLINTGQFDKWARSPSEPSMKGIRTLRRASQTKQLHLFS